MKYVITGINTLTGQREQLSRAMEKEDAQERLQREIDNRRRQKYQAHKRLKLEPYVAVQLTIPFNDYE